MTQAPRTSRSLRRSAGFTLLEIMIALGVGGIAIGSLYAVGAASTRHFREQQRISGAQTSLRAAMDQLKHDFQRAGFLSSPSVLMPGEACAPPTGIGAGIQVAGIAGYVQAATPPANLDVTPPLNSTAFYSVDQVWLTGNYATSGEYPGIQLDAAGTNVSVPIDWQTFRRDFSQWDGVNAGDCDNAAFEAAFPVGRLVRLHSLNGTYFYSQVARASCAGRNPGIISLSTAVPANCNMNGGWIAPVNVLRYAVVNATEAERGNDTRMTVLRRTEVQPLQPNDALQNSGQPIDDRAILDYVVRFNVQFLQRNNANQFINYVPVTAVAALANPERIRGAIIDVAVRTPQQEPEFTSSVPTAAFRLLSTMPGAARVRRARAEVMLSNVANGRF